MNATRRIISGLTLALALSLTMTTLGVAGVLIGSDYESGRIPEAAVGVRVPVGFHLGTVAMGSDFENRTIALPEGAKGGELLEVQSFADRGERLGPMNGSDYENLR
jgi:hypothetical protein